MIENVFFPAYTNPGYISPRQLSSFGSLCSLLFNKFPADIDENGNLFIGSIAICLRRAEEQAEEFGHSGERELNYLAAHGICHLLGYDHMTEEDKSVMREKEEQVLHRAGYSR